MTSTSTRGRDPGLGRVSAASVASTVQGALPAFLVGALAVQIGQDIVGGAASLGLAVTVFFAVSTIGSFPAGWLVERIGARVALLLCGAVSCFGLVVIGGLAQDWWHLMLGLGIAGVANAFAQPAANLLIFERSPRGTHGLLFGIKQGAVPGASLLAGAAVPLLGVTIGWRWAFGLAALVAAVWPLTLALPFAPRQRTSRPRRPLRGARSRPSGTSDLRRLRLIIVASALGAAVQTGQTVFLVPAAATHVTSPGAAGWLLALASLTAVGVRIVVGRIADRRGWSGRIVHATVALLVVSALGNVIMAATTHRPLLFSLGAVVSFGIGAGWNGLVVLAVIRRHEDRPATASGLLQTGSYGGGVVGPALFGVVAEWSGYGPVLWLAMAVAALLAGTLLWIDGGRDRTRRKAGST